MSRENVELVERVLKQARDDPTAFLEIVDDEARWEVSALDLPEGGGPYRGKAGVSEFFRRWVGGFTGWDYEVDQLIDAGDSVVIHLRQWGRGKGSGVPVTDDFWQVWTIREGKLIRRTRFPDKAAALEAVGLRE